MIRSNGRCAGNYSSQLPKFKLEATDLIESEGIEALAVYLVDRPEAGDVIPGSGGIRKSVGSEGQREARRGSNRLSVCRGRSPDLPPSVLREERKNGPDSGREEEKKKLRQIAAQLKGAQ
jgi:hypothetical protein